MPNKPQSILFFIFTVSSLNAQVLFCAVDSLEKDTIQNSMNIFYAEELIQAGLFDNQEAAFEAAINESAQQDLTYYQLTSEDKRRRYGYLVYSTQDQTAYLEAIYLEKQYQGQGLGKQILRSFEEHLSSQNIHLIRLYVFEHNQIAFSFYNKIGYEIETTYYLNDKPIGHHMKKDLVLTANSSIQD